MSSYRRETEKEGMGLALGERGEGGGEGVGVGEKKNTPFYDQRYNTILSSHQHTQYLPYGKTPLHPNPERWLPGFQNIL